MNIIIGLISNRAEINRSGLFTLSGLGRKSRNGYIDKSRDLSRFLKMTCRRYFKNIHRLRIRVLCRDDTERMIGVFGKEAEVFRKELR